MRRDERETKEPRYEDLFVALSAFVEKWMKRTLLILLAMLVVTQLLLQIPSLRYYLVKVEQLEGIPYVHTK
ncbi:hypothetical protein [Paenibacillus sp. UNC451MF]|uniref:hypothetical protein n=1 Tax=Paenibacillus sp. UNC451MF TaxID=1449063 RepID=UPI0004921002|nr:hypothetical protein [Paenibacillus sp. UNC451MF]